MRICWCRAGNRAEIVESITSFGRENNEAIAISRTIPSKMSGYRGLGVEVFAFNNLGRRDMNLTFEAFMHNGLGFRLCSDSIT